MAIKTTRRSDSMMTKAYAILRGEIVSCRILPGQGLSESELAIRFKMSRTPVREALGRLRTEGLVKAYPRIGYQVAPVTFHDMNELFEVRTTLEACAVELAAERIAPDEISRLQKLSDVLYNPAVQPSIHDFVQANRNFHEAIAKASGNSRLHTMIMQILDELQRYFYLGARLRDVSAETTASHKAVIDALKAHNASLARDLMIKHNDETRVGLLAALTQQTSRNMQFAVSVPTDSSAAPVERAPRTVRSRRVARTPA